MAAMSDERNGIRLRLEAQRDDLASRVDRLQAEASQSIGETDTAHCAKHA
jgi:hypothetical protein